MCCPGNRRRSSIVFFVLLQNSFKPLPLSFTHRNCFFLFSSSYYLTLFRLSPSFLSPSPFFFIVVIVIIRKQLQRMFELLPEDLGHPWADFDFPKCAYFSL